MEPSLDVVDLVSTLLDSGKYKEVLSIPNQEKYVDSFKDNCWDLISVVVGKISDETIVLKPSLHGTCEELLSIIIEKSAPEEALLEFIEQIEVAKNDAQFGIILSPLQHLLKKLSAKRGRSLEWCLNSISTYIETIPVPEHKLEGKERLLIDSDPNIRRIIRVYSMLPPFYAPFVKELNSSENIRSKQILTVFLISLLGKPLIYLDLDPDCNVKSEARPTCASIIQDICLLERDIIKLLQFVEICYKENQRTSSKTGINENEDEKYPYEQREKINLTSLSGLLYILFSGHFQVPETATPQVYSIEFIVHTSMLSVIHLLSFSEYGPLAKGISLCKAILNRFSKNQSHALLSSHVHFELCRCLVNVAIYSSYESIRKNAVTIIGFHVNLFEFKGRCMLIKYLLDASNHSGMIGYAITLYKNSIDEAFKDGVIPECFKGAQLMNMVSKICHLPHGAESDLVELADQIITSLNFLRYLALKDTNNITGICDNFASIENDYLDKLRTGLNMSKAHYEAKLKDLDEEQKHPERNVEVSINVGGNVLDNIPVENKKEIINSALNAFHLIEALRSSRRCICLSAVKSFASTPNIIRHYCQKVKVENEVKDILPVSNTEHDENQYEEDVKNKILSKALEFVTIHGWSTEAISSGAEAAGYPGVAHGLFPNGGGDLVHYFNVKCNKELVELMEGWPKPDLEDSANKVPAKFVEDAIVARLLMIVPYKDTWPRAIAIQTLPNNVQNCLASLLSLVDDICYYSGDRSVDFNWYLRRVGLAGIYKTAELFFLTDNSPEHSATRNFVRSRIRDAQLIQSALNLNPVTAAPQTLTAAFVTAKNILGMNSLK